MVSEKGHSSAEEMPSYHEGENGFTRTVSDIVTKSTEEQDELNDSIENMRRSCFRGVTCEILADPTHNEPGKSKYADQIEESLRKTCGESYVDFLKSGHPWARFWVQLKAGIVVIPRSEYVKYVQEILEIEVDDAENYDGNDATISSGRMKDKFMKKYKFESEEDVEDFLICELALIKLMPTKSAL
jgi:hypothetical protein